MKKILILISLSYLLAGCLGNKNEIKEDAIYLQSIPVCKSDDDCKKMWDAAGKWVDRYSPQGVEVYNDHVIRSEEKELGSDEMEIEIRKVKQPDGSFKIVIDNFCRRSGSSCTEQRNNIIAFNKMMSELIPAKAGLHNKTIFEADQQIKQWFDRYNQLVAGFKIDAVASMLHLPATYIENDDIRVITSVSDLKQYLEGLKNRFDKVKGIYLKTDSIDVFQHIGNNVYVNVIINLYDLENTVVAAQQLAFHLVNVKGKWLLVSSAAHTK